MKKLKYMLLLVLVLAFATGCNSSSEGEASKTGESKTDDEFTYKEAGIGDLKMKLEDIWVYQEAQSSDNGLAFSLENSILGVTYSKENTYQCAKDMVDRIEGIYAEYDGYEILKEAVPVSVNGNEWYEMEIKYEEDGQSMIVYRRCFGQDYHAYSLSFTAIEDEYEAGIEDAKMAMDTAELEIVPNDETVAKEFLVGEWGIGDGGLLVLNEDNTYQWYMDAESRDPGYMHEGTYGCDNEIKSMGTAEDMGTYYLCLMPDHLFSEGKEVEMGASAYHFAMSHESTDDDNVYQMINIQSMGMYSAIKIIEE